MVKGLLIFLAWYIGSAIVLPIAAYIAGIVLRYLNEDAKSTLHHEG